MLLSSAKAAWFTPYIGISTDYIVKSEQEQNDFGNAKNGMVVNTNLGSKININDYIFLFGEAYFNVKNDCFKINNSEFLKKML